MNIKSTTKVTEIHVHVQSRYMYKIPALCKKNCENSIASEYLANQSEKIISCLL